MAASSAVERPSKLGGGMGGGVVKGRKGKGGNGKGGLAPVAPPSDSGDAPAAAGVGAAEVAAG